MKSKITMAAGFIAVAFLLAQPSPALARDGSGTEQSTTTQSTSPERSSTTPTTTSTSGGSGTSGTSGRDASRPRTETEPQRSTSTESESTRRSETNENTETHQTHLEQAKLKVCQNREKSITNIISRISDRGQRQLDLFTKIAEKTEAFYVSKGKVLSNYNSLVAEVNAKKVSAQTAVNNAKVNGSDFTCDGNDPKGVADSFKTALKSQNDALKAYKTAIKNLIVGVKSVQTTTSTDATPSGGNR